MALRLQDIERLHVGLLGAAVCAAYVSGWLAPLSLLLGGAVMGANFWLMRQLAGRLFAPGRRRPEVVLGLMLIKFTIVIGLIGLLFWRVRLDPLAFGVGASLLLVACVAATLRQSPAATPS
jgi:hypothetical protein